MGIHGQAGQAKGNAPNDVRRLPADSGKRHQLLPLGGDLTIETIHECVRHTDDVAGLSAEEADRPNDLLDCIWIGNSQGGGVRVPSEQRLRHQVHTAIGALGREDGGREQLEGAVVLQRTQLFRRARKLVSQSLARDASTTGC